MPNGDSIRFDLKPLLERFPDDAILTRRLCLADQEFRSICEDYLRARHTLTRLQSSSNVGQELTIADYLSVIAALEEEIVALLRTARDRDAGPPSQGF